MRKPTLIILHACVILLRITANPKLDTFSFTFAILIAIDHYTVPDVDIDTY